MFEMINPPSGTANVVVTLAAGGGVNMCAGAISFNNVHQTTPRRATAVANSQSQPGGKGTNPIVTVTSVARDAVVDAAISSTGTTTMTAASPQLVEWNIDSNAGAGGGGETNLGCSILWATSTSTTMSWTLSVQDKWAIIATSLIPAVPPTVVRLREVTVTRDNRRILISWQTSFELDNLGFNIYRDVSGQRTKINKHLIAGTAFQSKQQDAEAGHVYRFGDSLDEGIFAQYWLEDVDTAGRHTMHGPVSPVGGVIDSEPNTTPLSGLGSGGEVFASPDGVGAARASVQEPASATQYAQQRDLASDNGLKIFVSQEGWYRLTRAAMTAAGFDPGADPRAISLYMLGAEQSIVVDDGDDGTLDANDTIEFYGYPLDSVSTGARTYWLRPKKGNEPRVAISKIKGGDPITGSASYVYERVERSGFFAALTTNGEADNFFGEVIGNWTATEPLKVGNLDPAYSGNATLDLVIQGGSLMEHRIAVAINGHDLSTVVLQRTEQPTFTFQLPQSWLVSGSNDVTLTSLNGDDDISGMAKSRLTYQHLLRADNGALDVSLPGGRSVTVGGFSVKTVRAFDITDPRHPTELQATVAADPQGGFAATFSTPADGMRTVLAIDSSRLLTPGELTANTPSSWSATTTSAKNSASFFIISHRSFLGAAATLKALRDNQGISTAVVDVDDLYDEFNFGIRSPEAIRSFFRAAAGWKHPPSAALLLGDASMDPRNYLGVASVDFVPTKLVPTFYMKTASDDWFTDFNGDGIADIPVGRIPVRTPQEASLVIGKITSRGTPAGPWSKTALFVADGPGGFDFPGV
ncbi:MAG TPA: C25 family cysteine peptidase, partial [Thermoanaerobaculia bacterium]|nr:C25 family cysteine peptidase [Thermoanaerobaculia bacterium]